MKKVFHIIILLAIFGCKERSNQVEFSYKEALFNLQAEIKKMEDGAMKNSLLWQTERIINQDTFYKHKLGSNEYDSLMYKIVWDEYLKYPLRQLELTYLNSVEASDRIEAYKFIYSRAFSDEIIIITISKQFNGLAFLKSQVFKQNRNCNPIVGSKKVDGSCFDIKLNETKMISQNEWTNFQSLIIQTNYWELEEDISNKDDVMLDGSDWIIEGTKPIIDSLNVKSQLHKKVLRWSPKEESPIHSIGKYLLDQNEYEWGKIY